MLKRCVNQGYISHDIVKGHLRVSKGYQYTSCNTEILLREICNAETEKFDTLYSYYLQNYEL